MLYVTKRVQFSATHRLHNPELSDEENREIFGLCNNPNGHGHNYEVEVTVRGRPEPRTGMVTNLTHLKQLLQTHVVGPADHRSLDHEVGFMKQRISTTENLAIAVWEALEPHVNEGTLYRVRIRESENNVVDYTGPETDS